MKTFNENEIKVIKSALLHYAAHQEEIISSYYLDVDHEQFVQESQQILEQLNNLTEYLNDTKTVHTVKPNDFKTINEAFVTSDEIYHSNTDFVLKAGMYLGLIDGIKAIFTKTDD